MPLWWAAPGDCVVAPRALLSDAAALGSRFGLDGEIADDPTGHTPEPWGWSADAVRQFRLAGVDADRLPADAVIARYRELSHRRSSITVLKVLGLEEQLPVELTDPDEAVAMHRRHPGCYMKSPWSSSGRGVAPLAGLTDEAVRDKAAGIIHRQGSVMMERGVDRLLDFAALFRSDGERVRFEGFSVFRTEPRGMYQGNLVAPQKCLEAMIGNLYPLHLLIMTIVRLEDILADLTRGYCGCMGIDMMIGRSSAGDNTLYPCVELNLRRTMGFTAMAVQRRLQLDTPRLLSWQRTGATSPASLPLLPPHEVFTLTLSQI